MADRKARAEEEPARLGGLRSLLALAGLRLPAVETPPLDLGVAQSALAEGLAPLLGSRLTAGELATDDVAAQELLVGRHRACLAEEAAHDEAAAAALAACAEEGVGVLPIKGLAWRRRLNRRAGERPMRDIDLLVAPRLRESASAALERVGFSRRRIAARQVTQRFDRERVFVRGLSVVDLQVSVAHPWLFPLDTAAAIARAKATTPESPLPTDEDLLLQGAVAAAADGLQVRLLGWLDLLRLLDGGSPQPAVVIARARAEGARRATAVALAVLDRLMPLAGPWRAAADELAAGEKLNGLVSAALGAPPESPREWLRRVRERRAALVDAPWRAHLFHGRGAVLRGADLLLSRWWRR